MSFPTGEIIRRWNEAQREFTRTKKILARIARREASALLRCIDWVPKKKEYQRDRITVFSFPGKLVTQKLERLAPYTQPHLSEINPRHYYGVNLGWDLNVHFTPGQLEMSGTPKQIKKLLGYLPKAKKAGK
jgi:hypothetical protein